MNITRILFLANEAERPAELLGLANELSIEPDGWALIPYGDSEHSGADGRHMANAAERPKPVIQRFDRKAAEAIVAEFNSPLTRFKRFIVGLPIFKGHPDAKRFAARFPDKTPHGTVAAVEATDRGFRFKPVLTSDGVDLVESKGWSAFSPYWPSRLIGEENGKRIYSPFKLISIGLLPPGSENIAGLSLANAVEGDDELYSANEKNMKEILIKLLAKMGITVGADATEQQLAPLVNQAEGIIAAANAKDAEITQLKAAQQTLSAELAAAKADGVALANAKDTEIQNAKTALATERAARAKLVVLGAVKTGRVVAANIDSETIALANAADFDQAAAAIEARTPSLSTSSRLADLGKAKEEKSRTDTVLDLVNAKMEEADFKKLPAEQRYDAAFSAVEKDPKYAALFAAMKVPGKS